MRNIAPSQAEADDSQNQQMGRVKQVKEPFGEIPPPFHPLPVVEADDDDSGQGNSCHAPQRVEKIGGGGKAPDAAREIKQPEQQRGYCKSGCRFVFGLAGPGEQQREYRRQQRQSEKSESRMSPATAAVLRTGFAILSSERRIRKQMSSVNIMFSPQNSSTPFSVIARQ